MGNSRKTLRILLVNHDIERFHVLSRLLHESEDSVYVIEHETDYEQACVKILANTHDAYLISYHLGDASGLDLIGEMAKDDSSVPLILLTSHADRDIEKVALESGAADFINYNKLDRELVERTIRYAIKRKEAEIRVRELNRRQSLLLDSVAEGIIGLDLEGKITFTNPASLRLLGYIDRDLVGEASTILLSKRQRKRNPLLMDLNTDKVEHLVTKNEERFMCAHGKTIPVEYTGAVICNNRGDYEGYVIIFQDITQRQKAEKQLAYLAEYDPLTGVANRFLFLKLLPQILARASRQNQNVAVLFLDLDDFKKINDTWGHDAGDMLLKQVALRLKNNLRKGDLIVRLGGDEFTIVVESAKNTRAIAIIAQKVIDCLSEPFSLGDSRELYITTSIGIAMYPECSQEPEDLLKYADQAMYHAKSLGGKCYQFFTENFNAAVKKRLHIETHLRNAIEKNEFHIHYQPQVDLKEQRITGVEALLRWQNSELGNVSPLDFIPIAEECGLILAIGEWVLQECAKQCKQWLDNGLVEPNFKIAVNIASQQLSAGEILNTVEDVLVDTDIPSRCLELELTESSVMENPEQSISILDRLRQLGVTISVDDFGTGYSSLSYLKSLPLSILKIDRSFIRDIFEDRNDEIIVKAIINLAHNLGIRVIAEGVETKEQLAFLVDHGCEAVQGYLFFKPMPASEFEKIIKQAINWDSYRVA